MNNFSRQPLTFVLKSIEISLDAQNYEKLGYNNLLRLAYVRSRNNTKTLLRKHKTYKTYRAMQKQIPKSFGPMLEAKWKPVQEYPHYFAS